MRDLKLKIKHPEFVVGSGELTRGELQRFLSDKCRKSRGFQSLRFAALHVHGLALEAAMRRTVEQASRGNMAAAKRFIGELESYGLLKSPERTDDHQSVIYVPKEWDWEAWTPCLTVTAHRRGRANMTV